MKVHRLITAIGLVLAAETASAACGAPSVQVTGATNLDSLLSGNTVCVGNPPTWNWQEEHHPGGALVDYKRGPGHPVDPTKQVGSWQISGDNVVYTYNGGGSFGFQIWNNGDGSYSFCGIIGTGNQIDAIIKPGTGSGCGGAPL